MYKCCLFCRYGNQNLTRSRNLRKSMYYFLLIVFVIINNNIIIIYSEDLSGYEYVEDAEERNKRLNMMKEYEEKLKVKN